MLAGEETLIAEVVEESFTPAAGVLSLKPGELQKDNCKDAFAWPIVVQCGRQAQYVKIDVPTDQPIIFS